MGGSQPLAVTHRSAAAMPGRKGSFSSPHSIGQPNGLCYKYDIDASQAFQMATSVGAAALPFLGAAGDRSWEGR
jgi:hypothetical protein